MKVVKELEDAKDVKSSEKKSSRVAAFFDLDGTMLPLPSLEKRFFQTLRFHGEIPLANYFFWLREALRLLQRGFHSVAHANKMYLRGVTSLSCSGEFTSPAETDAENCDEIPAHTSGRPAKFFGERGASQAGGQALATPPKRVRRNPRCPVPRFFEDALERAAWHASRGHVLVIVSGTLEPLAAAAARELGAELVARGFAREIRVCATRLDEIENKWTGRVLGEAMFGEAKARAVKKLAEQLQLDLARSYAYGDSINDEAMLEVVGNATAVNPSAKLARIAKRRGWALLRWNEEEELTQRTQSHREHREEQEVTKRRFLKSRCGMRSFADE